MRLTWLLLPLLTAALAGGWRALPSAQAVPLAVPRPALAQVITLTQSLSDVVQSGVTLACAETHAHYENSYYRVFTPTAPLRLQAVQFGLETAQGGDQPLGVRLHALAGPLTLANLTLLHAMTATVSNQELTRLTVPVSAFVPAHQPLAVELFVPDGIAANRLLYVGSNVLGETAPTYLRAPACGQAEPVPVAALGAGEAHLVLTVLGALAAPPSVVVSAPVSAPALAPVMLDASASTTEAGDALAFEWRQVSGPLVALSAAHLSRTTFLAPTTPGVLTWALTVTNALGLTATQVVSLAVTAPQVAVPPALTFTAPLSRTTVHTFSVRNDGAAPLTFSFNQGFSPTAVTAYTLTHSLSTTIEAGRAIKCAQHGFNTEASYYRVFNLPVFNLAGQEILVSGVTFGVEAASGGSQPVQVRLHRLVGPFTTANLTLLGAVDVWLADQTATQVTVPVSALVPANSQLVFEVAVPAGQTAGQTFFMGANALGQTAPSYLRAPACGYPQPVSLSAIDSTVQWVMTVHAHSVPCGGLPEAPWLSVSPLNGVALPGQTVTVQAALTPTDPTGHITALCLTTNDPAARRQALPVTLAIAPEWRVFLPVLIR